MQTGALSNGQCFESTAEAIDNYFSSRPPFSYTSGAFTFTSVYENQAGVWNNNIYATSAGSSASWLNSSVVAPLPVFPLCDAPSAFFYSGVQIGAAIVGVMVIGWGFSAAWKLFDRV